MKWFFREWKWYIIDRKENKQREDRKDEMRHKVHGWLSEYRAVSFFIKHLKLILLIVYLETKNVIFAFLTLYIQLYYFVNIFLT